MNWRSNKKQLLWTGVLAAVIGVLSVLPSVTSAAPKQGAASSPHLITPAEAEELIARFRANITPETLRGQFFYRNAFDALLAQPAAAGIRIYYGRHDDGAETFVLYATDSRGKVLPELAANLCRPVPPFHSAALTEAISPELAAKLAVATYPHLISPEQAQQSIARFQATAPPGSVLSYVFERSAFDALLAQPDAHGIWMHYAKDADGSNTLVLYGTDSLDRELKQLPMGHPRSEPPAEGARQ